MVDLVSVRRCLFVSVILSALSCASAAVTANDLREIKCSVMRAIDTFNSTRPNDLLPKIVRLSFHDCVGGCDGDIGLDRHGNEGLDVPINALQTAYAANFQKRGISRADFWAAAGSLALMRAAFRDRTSTMPPLKFYSGRIDKPASRASDGGKEMPSPHGGIEQSSISLLRCSIWE